MGNKKEYQPTPEEMARAEEMMSPAQKKISALKEKKLQELNAGEEEILTEYKNEQAVEALLKEAEVKRSYIKIKDTLGHILNRGYRRRETSNDWLEIEEGLDKLFLSLETRRNFYLAVFSGAYSELESESKGGWVDTYLGMIWQKAAKQALRKLNVPRSVEDYVNQKIDKATQAGKKAYDEKREKEGAE